MADRPLSVGMNLRKVNSKDFDYKKMETLIEQAYLDGNRGVSHKRKVSFAPSSIGYGHGTCPRRWYLSFAGAEFDESSDAVGIATMENGSATHDRLQRLFKSAGIAIEIEKEMNVLNPPIRAFIDVIAEVDGIKAIIEIKSTRDESFVHRRYGATPMAYHLYQLLLYMYFEGIDQGAIMYENKNDNTILTLPVRMNDYTRKIIEDAIEWMTMVYENWKQDATFETTEDTNPLDVKSDGYVESSYENLPKRPFTKRSKECKQCPLFNECWNIQPEGTVDLPPMEVVKL